MKCGLSLALLLAVAGCHNSTPKISCSDDAQCTLASRPGVCLEGSCAIPDTSCPSGYRYDTMAGGSGECVVVPPGTDLSMPDDMTATGDMASPPDMTMVDFAFNPPDMAGSGNTSLVWSAKSGGDANTDYKAIWGATPTDIYTVGSGTVEVVHFYNGSTITGTYSGGRLNGIWETSTGSAYAIGLGGAIIQLTNGGATNIAQTSGTAFELEGIWGANGTQTMYAVGTHGNVLLTTNSGGAWGAGTGPSASIIFLAVQGVGTDVYAVGVDTTNGSTFEPAIYHATVGANAWTAQTVPQIANVELRGVYAVSATELYAVGDKGTILKSTGDGTWAQISATTTTNGLFAVGGDGAGGVIAVGNAGTIVHKFSNNATAFFAENSGAPTEQLYGVWAAGANDVYVVGQAGTILHGQ